jgi:hypothetical protein
MPEPGLLQRFGVLVAAAGLAAGSFSPALGQVRAEGGIVTAAADAAGVDADAPEKALCTLIESAAAAHDLPVGFFTRLIWKESRFRSDAVSPKGAQGIAQFMPGTAAERGLEDPFDTRAAIPASASFLAELKGRFGNLGLAAAAYNAGPERVSDWLAEDATLPFETRDYVLSITGLAAETWADEDSAPPKEVLAATDCLVLAAQLKESGAPLDVDVETAEAPWGVQVAGGFSRMRAIGAYASLQKRFPTLLADRAPMIVGGRMAGRGSRSFYRVRVPVETRSEGEQVCAELKKAGGSCIVLRT